MNLALVGTGRMGAAVEAVAAERGHAVVARFDVDHPLLDAPGPDALAGADVCVDFSVPAVALDHLQRYADWRVDAVVGTTGWTDHLETVRGWVEAAGNGVLWAPNFSLGVALVVRALRGMLPLLNRLPDYDASVHEAHHVHKLDSPSGTALRLAEEVIAGLDRKTHIQAETQHGAIAPDALHVTSRGIGGRDRWAGITNRSHRCGIHPVPTRRGSETSPPMLRMSPIASWRVMALVLQLAVPIALLALLLVGAGWGEGSARRS